MVTAENEGEVLSAQRELEPDVIILELRQSKDQNRDEAEVFRALKKKYPNIPWIGYSTFTKCPENFTPWINFYLPKTCEIERLKKLLKCL